MYEAEAFYFGMEVELVTNVDGEPVAVEVGDASRLAPVVYVSRHVRMHNQSNRMEVAYELTSLPSYEAELHWASTIPSLSEVQKAAVNRYEDFQLQQYGPRWAETYPGGL